MDDEIRQNVELALSPLLAIALTVQVRDGVVIIEGAVESDGDVSEAERQIWRVEGVKEIVNRLVVERPEISLESLQADASEIAGEGYDIDAIENGEPYFPPTDPVVRPSSTSEEGLEVRGGFAPDSLDRTPAPHSHETPQHGDDEITDEVQRALALDALTAELEIEVETVDGVVHLRGNVDSVQEAEEVEAIAAGVPGVVEVVEELQLGWDQA